MNMSIYDLVSEGRSKALVEKILNAVGSDPEKVDTLIDLIENAEKHVSFNAGWVLYHLLENKNIEWSRYFDKLWPLLKDNILPAVARSILKYLWYLDKWPDDKFTEVADHLLQYVADPGAPIAYQALSMEALYKHLNPYPELLEELKLILEQGMPYGSAGYKNKAQKLVRKINKYN
ncbi:MAG: hypothetical protein KJP00_04555 [Bacteroidia bacterium]|nr:hypothetical protein [Bacteroidia bacterium]